MTDLNLSESELAAMSPAEFRSLVRRAKWTEATDRYKKDEKDIGPCSDYANANLVIFPKDYAFEFLLFYQRNSH